MFPIERITDPDAVDAAGIAALVANGSRPILQFSKPGFSDGMLDTVNALCERFGDALDVRFFGFYGDVFDCRVLRRLPAVSSLLVDCLQEASHVDEVAQLTKLRRLSLGIYLFDANAILAAPIRVRGVKRIEPERFGRLERLLVEDQIQLGGLRFDRSSSLSNLRVLNCKTFDRLEGLARLEVLDEIRVSRTKLDLDKLIEAGLPPRLRVFAFYTGSARENARARKRLDELGYIEFEKGPGVAC